MGRLIALVILLALAWPARGHEDRIFTLGADGTLQGLAEPWGPARLQVRFSGDAAYPVQAVELTTPRYTLRLKPCFLRQLHATSMRQVSVHGSWYHDLEKMPPYVALTFYTEALDPQDPYNDQQEILISLVDGRVLGGTRMWKRWWRPRSVGYERLKPEDLCPP